MSGESCTTDGSAEASGEQPQQAACRISEAIGSKMLPTAVSSWSSQKSAVAILDRQGGQVAHGRGLMLRRRFHRASRGLARLCAPSSA
jgi:hypothetical protein